MTIEELIYNHAQKSPEKIAIIDGVNTVTYAELWKRIVSAAVYFAMLSRGERIVMSASKNVDFVYCYFGAHLAGMICVPIDSETNSVRFNRIVNIANPKLIVGELHNSKGFHVVPFSDIVNKENDYAFSLPHEEDIADLLFTTGTTGLPKGVALSFGNESAAAKNINEFIGNTTDDIELIALPISHSFGLGRIRCVLSKGATLVMLGSFASMKKFYKAIEEQHVTGFGMVPASWSYIQKMSGTRISRFSDQIKYIEIGSAFMSVENKHKLMELLPNTRICMHYGLTEASRSAFISFQDDKDHLDSVGKASPNTETKIFSELGKSVKDGENGEICVKGKHVCSSYWGLSEERFKEDFFDDYFRTGDWGYKDSEGYVHMISRLKEIINVGGKKVSPIEVEEALNTIEGIDESACIAVHDDVLGEVVKAFVVGNNILEEKVMKGILMKKLENYKVPAFIEQINEIPKTQNGKIQRLKLK